MKPAVQKPAYSLQHPPGNPTRLLARDGFRMESFANDKPLSPQYSEFLSLLADILSVSPQERRCPVCAQPGR